jgi:hypothetical protein
MAQQLAEDIALFTANHCAPSYGEYSRSVGF